MTSLPFDCQTDDLNLTETESMDMDSLHFTLDNPIQDSFTGHFNGFGVEVRSLDEMSYLYLMSCFGKGSKSRSKPQLTQDNCSSTIMRKRQFQKRNYWHKKFESTEKTEDLFFNEVTALISKIVSDSKKQHGKEIIDLVSSDDENMEEATIDQNTSFCYDNFDSHDVIVVVPNSDSEDDNYFSKMKPKTCINRVQLQEKLILTLQEAFFLLYGLGCLQILNVDNNALSIETAWQLFSKTEQNFLEKYVVYHYFRSKGYIVKPGIKFGGDFLLYKEKPEINHAEYIVVVDSDEEKFDWISLLGHVRMANTTVKALLTRNFYLLPNNNVATIMSKPHYLCNILVAIDFRNGEVLLAKVHKPTKECVKLPEDLSQYSVRVMILTRNIPITINNDED